MTGSQSISEHWGSGDVYARISGSLVRRSLGKAMSRRSRAGGKPAKTQRRKTITPQRRNASKAVRSRNSDGRETKVARLVQELNGSATADVLRFIPVQPRIVSAGSMRSQRRPRGRSTQTALTSDALRRMPFWQSRRTSRRSRERAPC
jgi:hypothetical protein